MLKFVHLIISDKKTGLMFVVGCALAIAAFLACATYYINFWPTDSYRPYLPAAKHLFEHPFVSHIHEASGFQLIMRGKETLILGIAIMQRLLNDFESLYPNVLFLIITVFVSSVLIYQLLRHHFDQLTALFGFVLFAGCFWSYMYVLQGAHPPLVLMSLLLAIQALVWSNKKWWLYPLSGISLGFMLFSSPTAPVYMPYYLAYLAWHFYKTDPARRIKIVSMGTALIALGVMAVFLYFTLPDPYQYFQKYRAFLLFSKKGNDFIIWRHLIAPYFDVPDGFRGGGAVWIWRYFFLIMPAMFIVYLVSLVYLIWKGRLRKGLWLIALVSVSTPVCVEIIRVAQFGRNYFSWIVGIILVVCVAFYYLKREQRVNRAVVVYGVIFFLTLHLSFNGYAFFTDVLPARMDKTYVHHWFQRHQVNQVFTYRPHPYMDNLLPFINNSKQAYKIQFGGIQSIAQVKNGYILLPPFTGKSIWSSCVEKDFVSDPVLTFLFRSGYLEKYAVASFETLTSSRMWAQEQEVCTYLDLMLGKISAQDRRMGKIYILDMNILNEHLKGDLRR